MRNMKLDKIFNKYFLIPGIGIILIISTIYILYFTDLFVLREIRILGNNKVSKEEIIKIINLKGGERLYRIPLTEVKKRILNNFKYVENVIIVRKLPSTLEINIKEKKPIGILLYNNKKYLIDKKGEIISEALPIDYDFYPFIEIKNEEFKSKFFQFLVWLKNNKTYLPVYENLSKIILSQNRLIFITRKNIKIYFPVISEKSWEYFYKNLDRIMAYLYEKGLIEKVELIRMDYPIGEALIRFKV
ncbi:MAG: hypothetical protein DRP29_02200 [Thermodesulfobacteriota bacterium]|nr:MAG: hypothetical protein DRP29_02200 [Thermodesulfobacteriota bacterium]